MSHPESTFSQYLKRAVSKDIYAWKIMAAMQNGVPDLYFSGTANDLWSEIKWVKVPKREHTEILPGLSRLQARWLRGRYEEGRNVCVIVGSPIGCCVLQGEDMFGSIYKRHLCIPKKEIAQWIISQTLIQES